LSSKLYLLCSVLLPSRFYCMKAASQPLTKIKSDGGGGNGLVLQPTSGKYSNVVLWLHGLGDTADGWASLMPALDIPDTKFILPTASSIPISVNNGIAMPGWSDIYKLHHDSDEDKKGMTKSFERIKNLINAEIDKNQISPSRIVVAGFSQGGALALHTSLRSTYTLGGCIALSTWLPFRQEYPAAISSSATNLKILQVHGDEDLVVSLKWGEKSYEILKTLIQEPAPEFAVISGMGHSSDPEEIELVRKFLASVFKKE